MTSKLVSGEFCFCKFKKPLQDAMIGSLGFLFWTFPGWSQDKSRNPHPWHWLFITTIMWVSVQKTQFGQVNKVRNGVFSSCCYMGNKERAPSMLSNGSCWLLQIITYEHIFYTQAQMWHKHFVKNEAKPHVRSYTMLWCLFWNLFKHIL